MGVDLLFDGNSGRRLLAIPNSASDASDAAVICSELASLDDEMQRDDNKDGRGLPLRRQSFEDFGGVGRHGAGGG